MEVKERFINAYSNYIASITYETWEQARQVCAHNEEVITTRLIPVTLTKKELEQKKEKIQEACQMVSDLCDGKKWTMSVPVQDTDPDIVITEGLCEAEKVINELLKYVGESNV